jgi:putative ATP-dependent endonuclease of OLD family
MHLSNIKLWNFRKYGSEDQFDLLKPNLNLNFTRTLNVLIGENDSGKSAILDAIKLVLKTQSYEWIKVDFSDFYKEQVRFRIELRFDELSDEEAKHFTEWLSIEGEESDAVPFLKLIYDVSRNQERVLPSDIRAGGDDLGYPITAEAKEYLKITYLKPLRDAQNELTSKKNSRLSSILLGHEIFLDQEENYLVSEFREFNKKIEAFFSDDNNNELNDGEHNGKKVKDCIDEYLQSFCDSNKESQYKTTDANLKSILEKLEISIKDFINPGIGTLNRLFMAAEFLHLNKNNYDGLKLGLIEELEAHLHPQVQMKVIEHLQKIKGTQLILTTHSPNLASKVKLQHLIYCNGANAYPMGKEYTKLEESNYVYLEKFLDVTKANLFFAQGIILVEGWAEEILIPSIAKRLGFDLTKHEVAIINIGNVGFEHFSRIFLRKIEPEMEIPVSIITDIDIKEFEYKRASDTVDIICSVKDKKDQKIKSLEEKYNECKNKVFIAGRWTFEWCLFNSKAFSARFIDSLRKIHPRIFSEEQDVEKTLAKQLLKKTLEKTRLAYEFAKILDEGDDDICVSEDDSARYIFEAIKHVIKH